MNRRQLNDILELLEPKVLTGTADIDISAGVYTGYVELLNIAPSDVYGLSQLAIELDLNKTTTGWDDVSTASDTLDIAVFKKVDGTNYRHVLSATQLTATGDGSHATAGVRFDLAGLAKGEDVSIRVLLSDERGDIEIPYRITYCGRKAPTVTAVAAG